MKNAKIAFAALLFATATFTSCKDKETETDVETTEMTETTTDQTLTVDTMSTAVDTTNTPGTTGGEMEQVP